MRTSNVTDAPEARTAAKKRSEEGSAYVIALMILFVLTVIGISLTLVTQTEALVGSQERAIQSVFYAAEGGLSTGVARALAYNTQPFVYETRQEVSIPGVANPLTIAETVDMTGFITVGFSKCFGCEENFGTSDFAAVLFAATSTATRMGADLTGDEDVPLARKAITTMVQFFPADVALFMSDLRDDTGNKGRIKL